MSPPRLPRRRRRCPRCHARAGVPILYGFPMEDAIEAAERGEIVLGGDVIDPGQQPNHACTKCGHRWVSGWRRLLPRRGG